MKYWLFLTLGFVSAGHPGMFKNMPILAERAVKNTWDDALNDLDLLQSKVTHSYNDFVNWGESLHRLRYNIENDILKELFGNLGSSDFKKTLVKCGIFNLNEPDIKLVKDVCKAENPSYQLTKKSLSDLVDHSKLCELIPSKFKVSLDKTYDDFLLHKIVLLQKSEDGDSLIIVDNEEAKVMLESNQVIMNQNPFESIIQAHEQETQNICKDLKSLIQNMVDLSASGGILAGKISIK